MLLCPRDLSLSRADPRMRKSYASYARLRKLGKLPHSTYGTGKPC